MDHTFHSDTLHEVLSRLETDQEQGLSLQEGEKRLAEHGENRLEEAKQAGPCPSSPGAGRTGWTRPLFCSLFSSTR